MPSGPVALPMSNNQTGAKTVQRLTIHNLVKRDDIENFAEDVKAGLSSECKRLFPKYFYDALGSKLFEAICLTPEYYPARAEDQIFSLYADEIINSVPRRTTLIEMGSGSASKTSRIIEAILKQQSRLLFMPVDISQSAIETSSRVLLQSYTGLEIEAYASEYFDGLAAISKERRGATLALFLGSNIGNFEQQEAVDFLRALRAVLNSQDALILGADLKKDRRVLEAAYDDALGVTAAFNLNILVRINRELRADFDVRAFLHRAIYNAERGRMEMHIESLRRQEVAIRNLGMRVSFEEGERIHTENSQKYDLEQLAILAEKSGFELAKTWFDPDKQFSSNLFRAV